MAGRKRVPTDLKVVRGNPGKRALPKDEPKPSPDPPQVSGLLTPAALEWFELLVDRLDKQGRASESFEEVLALAADRCAQIVAYQKVLAEEGSHYDAKSTSGDNLIRVHPLLSQLNEAQRHLQSLLAELGLTPTSISKVAALTKSKGKRKNAFEDMPD